MSQANAAQGTALSQQQAALGMAQQTQSEQEYYNSMLQALLSNPASVSTLPGFQFQLATGSQAVADQMASQGFGGSGNEATALATFGQGLASSFYGQQAAILSALSGVTAASSPSSDISAGAQSTSAATSATSLEAQLLSGTLGGINNYARLIGNLGIGTGAAAGTPAGTAPATETNPIGFVL